MSIIELLKHVGEEKLECQWLNQSMDGASIVKGRGQVTFATDQSKVLSLICDQAKPMCLIVWIPRDLMPTHEQMHAPDAPKPT